MIGAIKSREGSSMDDLHKKKQALTMELGGYRTGSMKEVL